MDHTVPDRCPECDGRLFLIVNHHHVQRRVKCMSCRRYEVVTPLQAPFRPDEDARYLERLIRRDRRESPGA